MIRGLSAPLSARLLSIFPSKVSFCFAYGSGVKKQLGYGDDVSSAKKAQMIDLVYCVDDPHEWHQQNLKRNESHYSALKLFGINAIRIIQDDFGAGVYCNTLIPVDSETLIKYGVISTKSLINDLVDWNNLYVAGRLHKPITLLAQPSQAIQSAIDENFRHAVRTSLLLLPERFGYYELFHTIANLSYAGDFRMIFGENKNKVQNIVKPQLMDFKGLYSKTLQSFSQYVSAPDGIDGLLVQDKSYHAVRMQILGLPRCVKQNLAKRFNHTQLTEEVIETISKTTTYQRELQKSVNQIVWNSSVTQSLKNIPTAGFVKSIKYSWKKALKTFNL